MKNTYEIEFKSTTYRVYDVEASSKEEAEELAFNQLDNDLHASTAWKEAAEINHIVLRQRGKDV